MKYDLITDCPEKSDCSGIKWCPIIYRMRSVMNTAIGPEAVRSESREHVMGIHDFEAAEPSYLIGTSDHKGNNGLGGCQILPVLGTVRHIVRRELEKAYRISCEHLGIPDPVEGSTHY